MTGALPRASVIRKFFLALAAGVVYFLPGHLAVLALLAYVLFTAMASTTNTAKTRSLESRMSGVVTQLGATNSTANTALATANAAMPISGGTFTGPVTCGNLAVTGTLYGSGGPGGPLNVDAATTVDTLNVKNGSGLFYIGGTAMNIVTSPGTISGTGTNSQLTNAVNAIIGQLRSSHWFS